MRFPKARGVGVEAMEIWEPVEVENPARERDEGDGEPKCPGAFGEVTKFPPNSVREIEGSANHAAEEKKARVVVAKMGVTSPRPLSGSLDAVGGSISGRVK